MSQDGGWKDVSHELYEGDGWQDVSHELPPAESHKAQAALQGFGNAASFGYLPQLQALTEPATNAILEKIAQTETGADFLGVPKDSPFESDDYVKRRDDYAKMQKKLAEKETGSYLAGSLAGGLASGIATGGLLPGGPAATAGQRILQAGKTGAIMGAVANPGESEGEISPLQPGDRFKNAAIGFGTGSVIQGGLEGGSKVLAPPLKRASELIKPKLKAGWEDILATAEKLGIKVTPGMLNEREGFVERMEDSLQNSPSILGANVRNKRQAVQSGLDRHTGSLLEGATEQTPFQVGENFKAGLGQNIEDTAKPLSKTFDDVTESTKHIPVSEKSLQRITKNITDDELLSLASENSLAQKHLARMQRARNANDVKSVRTLLKADLASASGEDRLILSALDDKLANLEKNSITRAAIQAAKDGAGKNEFAQIAAEDEGREVAKQTLRDLMSARKGWRGLHEKMQSTGISSKGGPSAFMDRIDAIPNQSIQDKFLNPERLEVVQSLQKNFPEQFKLLRAGKLRDVLDASLYKGDVSSQKFVREVSKFDPEFQQMLFGEEAKKVGQMKTLLDALPKNFNPSGTNSASLFSMQGLKSNLTDIPRFMLYKAASNNGLRQGASNAADAVANAAQSATQAPQKVGAVMGSLVNPIKPFDEAPSPVLDMDKNLLNILGKNPQMIEKIKNPKLRDALMKHFDKQKGSQEIKDPRQSFIEGN